MPTHILNGTTPVRLPRGPLAVSVRSTGSPVRLDVRGDAETPVVRPASHLMVLPRVTAPVVLRIVPSGDVAFGPDTSVALTLGIDGVRGGAPEQAQLPAVDLTGLPHRDLLLVEPVDGGLSVRVPAPIDDEALPGLVGLARAATRRVLGVDRVPDQHAVRLVVVLDASASGRLLARSGATTAATQVVLGMARVLGADPPRVAVVAGDELTWVPPAAPAAMADESTRAVLAVPPTIGFRAAHPELRAAARRGGVVTYVVTDGAPADVAELEADAAADGAVRHLVVLGEAAPAAGDVTTTAWTHLRTVEGMPLADRLSQSPDRLDEIVRGLLRGCFAPDSELARRAST